jgi:hypothetical protein
MTTTVSVTQALAEIKLLRKRIEGDTLASFITVRTKKKSVRDTFAREASSSLQSHRDLLSRYNLFKSAVVLANATTQVQIGGKTYTVADAVERKRSISFEKALLKEMELQYNNVQKELKAHQEEQQERLDALLQKAVTGDRVASSPEAVDSLTKLFLKENAAELVDPLDLATKIKELRRTIEEFESEVDFRLSEANARTLITL